MEKVKSRVLIRFIAVFFMTMILSVTQRAFAKIEVETNMSVDNWRLIADELHIEKVTEGELIAGDFNWYPVEGLYVYHWTKDDKNPHLNGRHAVVQYENYTYDSTMQDDPNIEKEVYCIQSLQNVWTAGPNIHKVLNIWNAKNHTEKDASEDYSDENYLRELELIAYYGYDKDNINGLNHTSQDWKYATQMLLWRRQKPNWDLYFLSRHPGSGYYEEGAENHYTKFIVHDYDDEMAEIERLVAEHKKTPSFSEADLNQQLTIGQEICITDMNGVLQNYDIVSNSDDVSARKDGNKLYITSNSVGEVTIELRKQSTKYGKATVFYLCGDEHIASNAPGEYSKLMTYQNMIRVGDYTPISLKIKFQATGEKIKIKKKLKSTTGNFGAAKVSGATYGVYTDYNCTNEVASLVTMYNGSSFKSGFLPKQVYYVKEINAPRGTVLDKTVYTCDPKNAKIDGEGDLVYELELENIVKEADFKIYKVSKETSTVPSEPLAGAQFKFTYEDDANQTYLTNVSGIDGICTVNHIPYGKYIVSEVKVPEGCKKIEDFTVEVTEDEKRNEKPIELTVENEISTRIEVIKEIKDQECTDIGNASGAEFTVYTDPEAKIEYRDKNGNKIVIGPTDNNGYAISKELAMADSYYLKETKFPTGVNKNAIIPGENVAYKDKVYKVVIDGKEKVQQKVTNIPIENDLEIIKYVGETSDSKAQPLKGAQFTARLDSDPSVVIKSTITGADGKCTISGLKYGHYTIEETTVPKETLKCSNFKLFIQKDRTEKEKYEMRDVVFVNPKNTLDTVIKEWLNDKGYLEDEPKVMKIKIRKTDAERSDSDAPDFKQGAANLQGAIYTVYKDAACTQKVYDITVDHKDSNGYWYAETGDLKLGEYWVKEKVKKTENSNGKKVEYSYAEGYLVDPDVHYFMQDSEAQREKRSYHTSESKEPVIKNRIIIDKWLDKTTSSEKVKLGGIRFKIKSKDNGKEYFMTTDENGHAESELLPYGNYTVSEMPSSDYVYNVTFYINNEVASRRQEFDVEIDSHYTIAGTKYIYKLTDIPEKMQIKIRKIDADRPSEAAVDFAHGDATLQGAIYKLYKDATCTQEVINTDTNKPYEITVNKKDSEGYWYAQTGDLLVGEYWVKEKIQRTTVEKDKETGELIETNYSYAEGYLVDPTIYHFESKPGVQTVERTYHDDVSKEEVIRGKIEVAKGKQNGESTEIKPAVGAVLRLTLKKRPQVYYDAVVDENGHAEFFDKEYLKKYPDAEYTIPYGEYKITEIEAGENDQHTHYFMHPIEQITVSRQRQEFKFRVYEPTFEIHLKIVKIDADTNEKVAISGAKFKIWNCEEENFVNQVVYPSGTQDYFETNEDGEFYTPNILKAGDYIIYEIESPMSEDGKSGYYLEDKYRLPSDESQIGKKDGNGKLVTINKETCDVSEDVKPGDPIPAYFEVIMKDRPLTAKIDVYKQGPMFTDVREDISNYGKIKTPIFELRGLSGVQFDIYAAEDIKSPDRKVIHHRKDEYCGSIVTGEDGHGISEELYLGKYYLKESKASAGIIKNPDPIYVELKNENQTERVNIEHISVKNDKQNAELSFKKEFNGKKYDLDKDTYSVFGVFANEPINNYKGIRIIDKDDLLQVIKVTDKDPTVKSTVDLPEGKYYYKELDVSSSYIKDESKYEFMVKYDESNKPKMEIIGQNVINDPRRLYIIKLSTSSFIKGKTLVGTDGISEEALGKNVADLANQLQNKTLKEVEDMLVNTPSSNLIALPNAEYSVFLDKECTKPLKEIKENGELLDVKFSTNTCGIALLEGIPVGKYYLKETVAPFGHKIANEPVEVELTTNDNNAQLYRILCDPSETYTFTKLDVFTGESVPNCTFEIKDMDNTVICEFITNEKGEAYIPYNIFEKGKEYQYIELDAPDIYKEDGKLYKLNTEPHIFKFDYEIDEKNQIIFNEKHIVENYRPTRDVLVRKVDEETGEPLQGCKFTIALLDEKGELFVNGNGENVYAVKDAITNENGEYLVKNVPLGRYKFIEVEAPEGYDLAEQNMEGYEFEITSESPKTIIFEVTNTGDIAVYVLGSIFVVSILGILCTVIKNRKVNN